MTVCQAPTRYVVADDRGALYGPFLDATAGYTWARGENGCGCPFTIHELHMPADVGQSGVPRQGGE